jgi:hypothetical protein
MKEFTAEAHTSPGGRRQGRDAEFAEKSQRKETSGDYLVVRSPIFLDP